MLLCDIIPKQIGPSEKREIFVRSLIAAVLLALVQSGQLINAQNLLPQSLYQAMLDANKASIWVAFLNFNGQQLLYFTTIQTLHCRLKEIRYSINSDALDQEI